jgi:dTDP-4-amino-4,6-dideoxygalactose transaminase
MSQPRFAQYTGEPIPLARPRVADPERVARQIEAIVASGILTNGPYVRELEQRAAAYLDVRHCIAVASCTSGLMLALRAAELMGDVIVPSFTFAATAHAVAWNGLHPTFADVEPDTLTLDPEAVRRAIGMRTSAVVATHVYGTPADVDALTSLAAEHGIRLFFDAAHAFGSSHRSARVGRFGDAEVFSLSPTKVVVAGEGGIIATNDDVIAERCRIGRDYGNPGDYDCRLIGLNARMSELHAALALASLEDLDERLGERNRLAEDYRGVLGDVLGLGFPSIREGDRSTYKDFTVLVHPEIAGTSADELGRELGREGIETKRYYDPPVHRMRSYRFLGSAAQPLPVTEFAAERALTLPLWTGMRPAQIERVAAGIARAVSAR